METFKVLLNDGGMKHADAMGESGGEGISPNRLIPQAMLLLYSLYLSSTDASCNVKILVGAEELENFVTFELIAIGMMAAGMGGGVLVESRSLQT